jgi:hypothetical protein
MRSLIARVVVCLCGVGSLYAQSARVTGQVSDSRRGAVRGCEVVMRNTGTEGEFRTVTTDTGAFLLPPVPPGTYEVSASAAGFAVARLSNAPRQVQFSLRLRF